MQIKKWWAKKSYQWKGTFLGTTIGLIMSVISAITFEKCIGTGFCWTQGCDSICDFIIFDFLTAGYLVIAFSISSVVPIPQMFQSDFILLHIITIFSLTCVFGIIGMFIGYLTQKFKK